MKKKVTQKAVVQRVDKLQAFTPTKPKFSCDVLAGYRKDGR